MTRALVVLGCLLLAACAKSPVPITAPAGNKADDTLLGKWRYTWDEDTGLAVIRKGVNGELIVTEENPENGVEPADFHVIVARLDRQCYASAYVIVAPPGEKPLPPDYTLLRYEWRDADHFAVYNADLDLLMDAVNRKLIAGARRLPEIELSASAGDLRAFVKEHGARVFSAEPVEFTRVKTTPTRR